jgi:hypothetical protein
MFVCISWSVGRREWVPGYMDDLSVLETMHSGALFQIGSFELNKAVTSITYHMSQTVKVILFYFRNVLPQCVRHRIYIPGCAFTSLTRYQTIATPV